MNRFFEFDNLKSPLSLQHENYALLSQSFQRMQAQNVTSTPAFTSSNTFEPNTPVVINTNNSGEPRPLPNLVAPGRFDVICAR